MGHNKLMYVGRSSGSQLATMFNQGLCPMVGIGTRSWRTTANRRALGDSLKFLKEQGSCYADGAPAIRTPDAGTSWDLGTIW